MESPTVAALALGAAPMANPRPQIAEAFFEQPSQGFDFPVTGESQAIRTLPVVGRSGA